MSRSPRRSPEPRILMNYGVRPATTNQDCEQQLDIDRQKPPEGGKRHRHPQHEPARSRPAGGNASVGSRAVPEGRAPHTTRTPACVGNPAAPEGRTPHATRTPHAWESTPTHRAALPTQFGRQPRGAPQGQRPPLLGRRDAASRATDRPSLPRGGRTADPPRGLANLEFVRDTGHGGTNLIHVIRKLGAAQLGNAINSR
jgi:hypothetical protein